MLALGLGPGDEVIVPAYTFPATANVVALVGATARLVDVDPGTMNLDLARVADAIGPRTRAVIAVHLFGRPLDWDALRAAVPDERRARRGRRRRARRAPRGRPCGSLGVVGCLSFHPRKIVTTGEGGAVTTDDERSPTQCAGCATTGSSRAASSTSPRPARTTGSPTSSARSGIPQVRRLDELLAARARVAAAYTERLAAS